ncbi:MAG: beta-lactamase family protein [Oscillospiraceae bacterium]|nr:beta-lactamase family protein [Oscillospiraceae bacterium]
MDFTKVINYLESLSDIGIPGTDLSLYLKGNEVFRHQTGFADLESQTPIKPDTLYAIWSMTKVVTCAAALRFYEEGKFLLTDPLYEYLPDFKDMTFRKTRANGEVDIEPCTQPIKIVDLFTMSSGLTYNVSNKLIAAAETAKNKDLQEAVSALSKEALYFEPGTRWHYGLSHDVLGALIEVLSGKTFGEYLHDNIFAPLDMEDTFFSLSIPEDKAGRIATAYEFDEITRKHKKAAPTPMIGDWRFESGGGGLISSVDDYAKFANTLCSGGTASNGYRLLGKATVDLMKTNHLDNTRLGDYRWGHHSGYGYGLGVRTMIDKAAGGSNSSPGEFGWSGMLGTVVVMDPTAELTYVYAQQLMPSKEEYVAPRLRNVIYSCL